MRLTFVVLSLCSNIATAAPFIVSDPYPLSSPQPTEFVITIQGQPSPIISSAVSGADGAYMKWDIVGIAGQKTITVKARNAWGESANSGPFSFVAGATSVPSNLRIEP